MAAWRSTRRENGSWLAVTLVVTAVVCSRGPRAAAQAWSFSDQTVAARLSYQHGYVGGASTSVRAEAGGVAAGDYDGDGFVDLYAVHGDTGANLLFHNNGDGTFDDVASAAGVAAPGTLGSGPVFADYDGDGRLDLLVLGIETTSPKLFHNRGDGTFEDVTAASGLAVTENSLSASWGDYDRDGDLDLFITHWGTVLSDVGPTQSLWRNNGDGTFTDVSDVTGISDGIRARARVSFDYTFTANFADINNDGWPDLLISSDFGTSMVFLNQQNGGFAHVTDPAVITDQNGMGGSVADYDGDGNLDWFVTSIWNTTSGKTGNRLYRGHGDGTFTDVTSTAGVAIGYWGWGCTFADLNNDGNVDIYHVNGFGAGSNDPARLFVSNGDGTFTEQATAKGVDDRGSGRGVVAFDFDHDGDLDLFVANNSGASRFYRNDGGNAQHWLDVRLRGLPPNTEGIGARVFATTAGHVQFRELRAGSNFESQDPAIAHFGLGAATSVDTLRVVWPDGAERVLTNVSANQLLSVTDLRSTPTPTQTTGTKTPTQTATSTRTGTVTRTRTPTRTAAATPSPSPSATPTLSTTPSPSPTGTPSASPTSTATRTATPTGTRTPTTSPSATATPTASATGTSTWTRTSTATQTRTATPSETVPATATPTGTPSATATTTSSPTPALVGISGHISYYSNGQPVGGAAVLLNGSVTDAVSDANGDYAVGAPGAGTWELQPQKLGDAGTAITALDAVYILQSTVGLRTFNDRQKLACDVTGNGAISALDAAVILRYKVGLLSALPVRQLCHSDWLFVPNPAPAPNQQIAVPLVAPGPCQSGAITWEPLATQADHQDFSAVLFGDCTGNWQPPAAALTWSGAGAAAVRVGRPEPTRRAHHLRVPITLPSELTFQEMDLDLDYDATQLALAAVHRVGAARAAVVQVNHSVPGAIRLALAGRRPLRGGTVLMLEFQTTGHTARDAVRLRRATVDGGP